MNGRERFLCPTVMITLVNLMLVSKYLTNLKRKCSFIVNLWPSVIYKFFLMPSGNGDVSYSLVTYESQARLMIWLRLRSRFFFLLLFTKRSADRILTKGTLTYESQAQLLIIKFFSLYYFLLKEVKTGYWLSKGTLAYESQDHFKILLLRSIYIFSSQVCLRVKCGYVVTLWHGEAHYDSEQCHVWRLYFAIRHFYLNLRPS